MSAQNKELLSRGKYNAAFQFQTRRRINFEKCKAIYNEDMDRKIQFVLRKN